MRRSEGASHREIHLIRSDRGISIGILGSPCLMSWCKVFSVLPWQAPIDKVERVVGSVHYDLGFAVVDMRVGDKYVSEVAVKHVSFKVARSSWHMVVYSRSIAS